MKIASGITRFILAAAFILALPVLFPFTSAHGLDYVKAHGKLLLFAIGLVNVFCGGALAGGFFSKNPIDGFKYWFGHSSDNGSINPTYGFGAIALIWNLISIIFVVEP